MTKKISTTWFYHDQAFVNHLFETKLVQQRKHVSYQLNRQLWRIGFKQSKKFLVLTSGKVMKNKAIVVHDPFADDWRMQTFQNKLGQVPTNK